MKNISSNHLLFLAWVLALISGAGSLFFSEIMELAPCKLCWYQRIALFPLIVILLRGFLKEDLESVNYALPFSLGGMLIALYHNLLKWGVVPESMAPCQQGVSCKTEYLNLFGFLSIPLMSLLVTASITILLVWIKRRKA